ncbi:MAG: carbon storage regulator [Planctomycetota bacterium]
MLVLSRKVGEKVLVGNDVTLEIVRVNGNRITVGIHAPIDVKILRGELAEKERRGLDVEKVELPMMEFVFDAESEAAHAC